LSLLKKKRNTYCFDYKKKLFIIHDCNRVFQQRHPCHLRSASHRAPLPVTVANPPPRRPAHQSHMSDQPFYINADHSQRSQPRHKYTPIYCLQLPQHLSFHQQQPQPSPTTFCYNNRSPRHRHQPTQTATAAATGRPHQQQ